MVSFVNIVWHPSMIKSFTEYIMTRAKATPPMVSPKSFNGDGDLGVFQEVGFTPSVLPCSPWWPPTRSCAVQYTATSTSPAVTTVLFNLAGITSNNHPFHTRYNDRHGLYRTRVHSRLFFSRLESRHVSLWRLGGMLWSAAVCGRTQRAISDGLHDRRYVGTAANAGSGMVLGRESNGGCSVYSAQHFEFKYVCCCSRCCHFPSDFIQDRW